MMSETCITSSAAATRGMTFLPEAVEAATAASKPGISFDDQRSHLLGELVPKVRRIRKQHLRYAIELGGGLGDRLGVAPATRTCTFWPMALAALMALATAGDKCLVVVLGKKEDVHERAPASLSLATSSAALATLMPALRPGGSTVFRTFKRWAMSTP